MLKWLLGLFRPVSIDLSAYTESYKKVTADLRKDMERRARLMREYETGKPIVRVKAGSNKIYTEEQKRQIEEADKAWRAEQSRTTAMIQQAYILLGQQSASCSSASLAQINHCYYQQMHQSPY